MNRVLVIGERPEEATALAVRLGVVGFESAPSASPLALALRSVFAFKPDAIILDVSAGNGARELFQMLERICQVPLLVFGDANSEEDLVWYLDEGAFAYLPRPVSPALLAARLTTLFRRTALTERGGVIQVGGVTVDLDRRQIQRNGTIVSLTPTEFRLLQALAEHAGRACSQRFLLERVWGEDFGRCAHYLRLYIGYLRQKLEDDPKKPRLLITEWGVGYRLVADQKAVPAPALRPVPVPVAVA